MKVGTLYVTITKRNYRPSRTASSINISDDYAM